MANTADPTNPTPARTPGAPTTTYQVRNRLRLLQWAALLVGGVGGLVAAGIGLQRWLLAYTHYGPAVIWRWSVPWFATALALSPALLLGLLSIWRARRTWIALYPSGLVYREGRREASLPWPEIQSLRTVGSMFGGGQPAALVIEATDDRRLRLTRDLIEFEDLVRRIKEQVYPRMHKALAQSFNRGQPLQFGPVYLDRHGLAVQHQRLTWEQVGSAELAGGYLRIQPVNGSRRPVVRLPASRVPNVDLCLQMIRSMLEQV